MKFILKWIAIFVVLTVMLPLLLNLRFSVERNTARLPDSGSKIDVYFVESDKVVSMDTERYILGVTMAEMPAEFELEALKAQSVAARTYLYEKLNNKKTAEEHKGADICTDFSHCQAYITKKEAMAKWGKNASLYFEKCKNAVSQTYGVIIKYDNKPIKAVFHAYASGRTENASDVWQGGVEYLKSVNSPGDFTAPEFQSSLKLSREDFCTIASEKFGSVFTNDLVGDVTYTEGGSVKNIRVGDKTVSGSEMRMAFGLKSACFEIKTQDNDVLFDVRGYGHGVGMSQYGANYYASQGLKYDEILLKYYSGVEISSIR